MEKINVAELLKNCPKGMELDCTCADNVVFDKIIEYEQIKCVIGDCHDPLILDKYGRLLYVCLPKCVIFPKGKTTWEGFQTPFKDGDIITCNNGACTFTSIFKDKLTDKRFQRYCSVILDDNTFRVGVKYADYANPRFATEEEKQKLFQAIKDNGYKWNSETKTLENLIKPKFDITTLVPFKSEVLVRNDESQYWIPAFWGCKRADGYTTTFGWCKYCIPYEGNEHLLETNKDYNEYYKTWKQ